MTSLREQYENGSRTLHDIAGTALSRLDPKDPDAILDDLPLTALVLMGQIIKTYRQGKLVVLNGSMPSKEQIDAAAKWLGELATEDWTGESAKKGFPESSL